MVFVLEFREPVVVPWRSIRLNNTNTRMGDLGEGHDQVVPALEVLHAIDLHIEHHFALPKGE